MTVWEFYSKEQQQDYISFIKMYASLSKMFNQKSSTTGAPYLDSKFQETIYSRSFGAKEVDVGNTPHDMLSVFGSKRIGIGIKTWLNSRESYQKVMQLKAYKSEIEKVIISGKLEDIAYKISSIKNEKLKTDYARLGLSDNGSDNIYHYITRDEGKLVIHETAYPLVNINNLKEFNMTKTSFSFTDGLKDYKFTFGDSQIWMKFGKTSDCTLIDEIYVGIIDDPFQFLKEAFENRNKIVLYDDIKPKEKSDAVYLPLYSIQGKGEVPSKSGLNAFNGAPKSRGSNRDRPEAEAYIPIPAEFRNKYPYWFDDSVDIRKYDQYKTITGKSSIELELHLPNGKVYPARLAQENFKSLQTNPQSALGKWLLYDVLHLEKKEIVTRTILNKAGFDSVRIWHEDPDNKKELWIDFAPLGSYELFMGRKDSSDFTDLNDD